MNELSYDFKKGVRTYIAIMTAYAMIAGIIFLDTLVYTVSEAVVEAFLPQLMSLLILLNVAILIIFYYVTSLGLAYIASRINKEKIEASKVSSIFHKRTLISNAFSLLIRWVAISVIALPFGTTLFRATPDLIEDYEILQSVPAVILFWILIFLPAMVVAMLLSMVPYLLADPEFDQVNNSPIKNSIKMIKSYFLRIFALRFVFYVWFTALGAGFLIFYIDFYVGFYGIGESVFGDQATGEHFETILLIATIATPLVVMPLYRLMHGVIYTKLKPGQKNTGIAPDSKSVSMADPEKS